HGDLARSADDKLDQWICVRTLHIINLINPTVCFDINSCILTSISKLYILSRGSPHLKLYFFFSQWDAIYYHVECIVQFSDVKYETVISYRCGETAIDGRPARVEFAI